MAVEYKLSGVWERRVVGREILRAKVGLLFGGSNLPTPTPSRCGRGKWYGMGNSGRRLADSPCPGLLSRRPFGTSECAGAKGVFGVGIGEFCPPGIDVSGDLLENLLGISLNLILTN